MRFNSLWADVDESLQVFNGAYTSGCRQHLEVVLLKMLGNKNPSYNMARKALSALVESSCNKPKLNLKFYASELLMNFCWEKPIPLTVIWFHGFIEFPLLLDEAPSVPQPPRLKSITSSFLSRSGSKPAENQI